MLARTRMIAVLAGLTAGGARAQPPATEPPAPAAPAATPTAPPERSVTVSLHVSGEFGFESDFTDSPGKVQLTRAGAGVDVGIPIANYCQLTLGFDYDHSNYDFRGATGFIPGTSSPFDNVNREVFSARFAQHLSQEWQYFVGAAVSLSAEEGADTGEGVGGVFYAAPQYTVNERLSIGLGILVATRLEDNTQVLPLVTIDWTIAEHWTLSNNGKPGLTLTYSPWDEWAFSLSGNYEFRDFRLDRDGPLPDGIGRETRIPVTLAAAWTPDRRITAEAGVGIAFGQNYELLDSSGNSVADIDADAAPFFMMRLAFRF